MGLLTSRVHSPCASTSLSGRSCNSEIVVWKILLLAEVVVYAWLMFDSLRPTDIVQLCRVDPIPAPPPTGVAGELHSAGQRILMLARVACGAALTGMIGAAFSHVQTDVDLIGAWRVTVVLVGLAALPVFATAGGRITEHLWRCRLAIGRKQFESRMGAFWMGRLIGLGLGALALTLISS